jgi:O-antigen/teichoic acid export membrane protein
VQVGKQGVFTRSVVIGSLINVLCNLLLVSNFGGMGAAIASVIAEGGVFLYQMKYFKEEFTLFQVFKLSINNIISGLIMLIIVVALTNCLSVSILNTVIEILVGGIIYIIILFVLKDKFINDLVNQVYVGVKNKLK